jgi:arylsulfatase A-like enzyme
MDKDVGRLLQLLRDVKLDNNTLVFFSSDNGPASEGGCDPNFSDANGPLRGMKGDLWEGGIRVPFIARWPGSVPAGKVSNSPIHFADVLPTLAAIASGKTPGGIDGIDFSRALRGSDQPELLDRHLYWEFDKNGLQRQAARWRNWKAVKAPYTKPVQLFDLSSDISEEHDVAAANPEIVRRLDEYIRTARAESADWPVAQQAPRSNKNKNIPAAL